MAKHTWLQCTLDLRAYLIAMHTFSAMHTLLKSILACNAMQCILDWSAVQCSAVGAFPREKSAGEGGDRDAYGDPMLSLPQMILLLFIIIVLLQRYRWSWSWLIGGSSSGLAYLLHPHPPSHQPYTDDHIHPIDDVFWIIFFIVTKRKVSKIQSWCLC